MNEKQEVTEGLEDLGAVSEETRGWFIGYAWDGGFGRRCPCG